jgi:hypothetical protein
MKYNKNAYVQDMQLSWEKQETATPCCYSRHLEGLNRIDLKEKLQVM